MAKNNKAPNINIFGGLVILGVLVIGVLVTDSQLIKQQNLKQEASGKPFLSSDSPNIMLIEPNPTLGDYIHFNYLLPTGVNEEPTENGTQARIQVICTQSVPFTYTDNNGNNKTQDNPIIYKESFNAKDINATTRGLLLGGGSIWLMHGGTANCTATLFQWQNNGGQQTFNTFASVNFTAAGIQ